MPTYLVLEIFNEYKYNKLYENSTYKKYVMEEIFIQSYILNKYNVKNFNNFCFIYGDSNTITNDPNNILNKLLYFIVFYL